MNLQCEECGLTDTRISVDDNDTDQTGKYFSNISQSNPALKSFGTISSYGLGLIAAIISKESIQYGRDSCMDH